MKRAITELDAALGIIGIIISWVILSIVILSA